MAENPLEHVAEAGEISIGFTRPDGTTGATPVWVVRVAGDIFVRSMNGPAGGWYRRLRARPDGEVRDAEHTHPVHAEPVRDAKVVQQVSRAYGTKYAKSPYVPALLGAGAETATLRLTPR